MAGLVSDLWWLDQSQIDRFTYLELGHGELVDEYTIPTIKAQICQITAVDNFRQCFQDINVYRSLKISNARLNGQEIIGPFLVDIDNEKDLDASHSVAKQVLDYFITQLKLIISDLRVFFTGHKGFNIEILPKTLNIGGSVPDQIMLSSKNLDNIITILRKNNNVQDSTVNMVDGRGTVIDRIYGDRFGYNLKHPFVRLHNSINKWIASDSKAIARRKIELTYQQLFEKSALEITRDSQSQV